MTAHAAAQAHIRPHVLQGYLPLPHQGRTLATDYLNLDAPEREGVAFDWAAAMDDTRSRWRNDTPWGGRPCRTYKHYVL